MGISERWQAVEIIMCELMEPVTFQTLAHPPWGADLGKGFFYYFFKI